MWQSPHRSSVICSPGAAIAAVNTVTHRNELVTLPTNSYSITRYSHISSQQAAKSRARESASQGQCKQYEASLRSNNNTTTSIKGRLRLSIQLLGSVAIRPRKSQLISAGPIILEFQSQFTQSNAPIGQKMRHRRRLACK